MMKVLRICPIPPSLYLAAHFVAIPHALTCNFCSRSPPIPATRPPRQLLLKLRAPCVRDPCARNMRCAAYFPNCTFFRLPFVRVPPDSNPNDAPDQRSTNPGPPGLGPYRTIRIVRQQHKITCWPRALPVSQNARGAQCGHPRANTHARIAHIL